MVHVIAQYFNINRILLLAVGLWPYQQSKIVKLQIIFYFTMLTSLIVFQLATFITAECNFDLVVNVFESTLFSIIYVITYNSFWINAKNVRYLLDEFQQICNELNDENEIAIIETYGSNAKHFTIGLTSLVTFFMCIIVAQPIWPRILGLLFINESRVHGAMQITNEYFIDQERYFYLIVLYTNAALCIGMIVVTATGTTLMICLSHICGMFKIVSYRIEQAMEIYIAQNIDLVNEIITYKQIIHAVDIHRKAMNFSEFLVSSFEGSYLVLTVIAVACLSLNLFGIISFRGNVEGLLSNISYAILVLVYMFLANYISQEVTDHNNQVFATVYSVQWYKAPVHIQRMMLFLLQRGTKAFNLKLGGLIVASLEHFSMLVSASMSYFAVLYSTRQ